MVTASLATLPDRVEMLRSAVDSLLPQVDRLHVNLNGHKRRPQFLKHEKIKVYHHDNSMGDLAKFYNLERVRGYIFTCDDDLIYPDDHVQRLVAKIEMYERQYPVTVHGAIKKPPPLSSYYGDTLVDGKKYRFHWAFENREDVFIDTGGTGCMAWHSDTMRVSYRILKNMMPKIAGELGCEPSDLINMADIWFKWFCGSRKIVCVSHPEKYFIHLDPPDTIWKQFCYEKDGRFFHDRYQTALWNYIHKK